MLHPVYLLEYIQASPQSQAVPSAGKWYKTKVQPIQGLHLLCINDVNENLLSSPLVFQRYPHRSPALFMESEIRCTVLLPAVLNHLDKSEAELCRPGAVALSLLPPKQVSVPE